MLSRFWVRHRGLIMLLPVLVLFIVFFLLPLFLVFEFSFFTFLPGGFYTETLTLANYVRFITISIYPTYLLNTFLISLESTLVSIFLAYPITHFLVRTSSKRMRKILVSITFLTFFMGSIPEVFSLLVTFHTVDYYLQFLGLQPIPYFGQTWSVVLGIVAFLMPIAVFSMLGNLRNIDPVLEDASNSLGAGEVRTFVKITLPLSVPGLTAAFLLCFTVGTTAFAAPQILGAGIINMMSNVIYTSFLETVNYPFGAALGVILLTSSLVLVYGVERFLTRRVRL